MAPTTTPPLNFALLTRSNQAHKYLFEAYYNGLRIAQRQSSGIGSYQFMLLGRFLHAGAEWQKLGLYFFYDQCEEERRKYEAMGTFELVVAIEPSQTAKDLAQQLANTFYLPATDPRVLGFALQVAQAGLAPRLRQQLADYVVCGYLKVQPLSSSFEVWANVGGDFLLGNWNGPDYAELRAAAEKQLGKTADAL